MYPLEWWNWVTLAVSAAFYGGGHVGIYAGNGNVVHALDYGQPVKVAPMRYVISPPRDASDAPPVGRRTVRGRVRSPPRASTPSTTVALKVGVLVVDSGIVWRVVGVVVASWSGAGCARVRECSTRSGG